MPRKAKKADVFDPSEEAMAMTKPTRGAATRSKKAVKSAEAPPPEHEVDAEPKLSTKRQTRTTKQSTKAAPKSKASRATRTTRKAVESTEVLDDDDVASTLPASPAEMASPAPSVQESVKPKKGRRPRATAKAKKTTARKDTSAASTAPPSPTIEASEQPSIDTSIEGSVVEEVLSKETSMAPPEEEVTGPTESEPIEPTEAQPVEEETKEQEPTEPAPAEKSADASMGMDEPMPGASEEDAVNVASASTELPTEASASAPPDYLTEAELAEMEKYIATEHGVHFKRWSKEEQVIMDEKADRELTERKRQVQETEAAAAKAAEEAEKERRAQPKNAASQEKTPVVSTVRSERKSRQKATVPSIQTSQRGTRAHPSSALTTPVQQMSEARTTKGSQRRPAQPVAGPPPPLPSALPVETNLEAEAVPAAQVPRRPLAEKPPESSRLPTAIPVRKALVPKPVDPPVPPPKVPQRSSVPEAQPMEKVVPPPLLAAPNKLTLASPLIKHKKKKRSSSSSRQTEAVAGPDARHSVLPDYVMRPSMAHTLMYTPPTVDRHQKQARREEADPTETPAPRRTSLVQPPPHRPVAVARASLQETKETTEAPPPPTTEETTLGGTVQDLLNFEHELAATMAEINGSLLPSPIQTLQRTQALHKPPITTPLKTVVTMGAEEEKEEEGKEAPPAAAPLSEKAPSPAKVPATEPSKPAKPASSIKPSVAKPIVAHKPLQKAEFKKPEVKRPQETSHLLKPSTKSALPSSHASATAATEAASRHELAALRRQQQEEARLANLRQKQEEREKKRLEAKRKEEEAKHKKPFAKENRGGHANQHGPPAAAATGVKRKADTEEAEATKVPESAQKKIKAVTPKANSAPEAPERPEEIRKSIEQLERDLKDQKKKLRASLQETTDLSSYELTATGTPNGLARIESDDSDGELASLQKRKRTGPTWAQTPALKQSLMAQQSQDPDSLLGDIPIPPLDLETIFGRKTNRYRARTSSAHWTGTDQLTKDEQEHYQTMMGFRP